MTSLIMYLNDIYQHYVNEKADPRTMNWWFIDNPLYLILCIAVYNLIVLKIGPFMMRNRKAYNVKSAMTLYNLSQVVSNLFFFEECMRLIWFKRRHNLFCEEVDYSNDPLAVWIAKLTWLFMITKILDLLDTLFMVLRKKENQITFLHVYHHAAMVLASWMTVRYVPGGHVVVFGTVNSFVHVVMYFYYFLTSIYPQYKKNIWWKRHITEIQLIQFLVNLVHCIVVLLNPYCNFPKILIALFIPQDLFMFALFWDFYKKAYLSKGKQKDNEVSDKHITATKTTQEKNNDKDK